MMHTPRHHTRYHTRHGVAMLLVLISLAIATILTMSYLASRDNSAVIGDNVASSAAARWAAVSGLDVGVAILETEADWRTDHTNGKLLDDYPIGDGTLDLDVIDLETKAPPTAETDRVELTATAVVGGMEQVACAIATVDPDGDCIDVDLSEFAIYASDSVTIENNASVGRWSSSPLGTLGLGINVGVQSSAAGAIAVNNNGCMIDTTVWAGPHASGSLVTNSGPAVSMQETSDVIPLPDPCLPPASGPDGTSLDLTSLADTVLVTDARFNAVQAAASTSITVQGDLDLTIDNGLLLQPGAGLIIDGDVDLVVYGDVDLLSGAFIELTDGSQLDLFVQGDISLDDAYVGDLRVDRSVRNNLGDASWIHPSRITVYSVPVYTDAKTRTNVLAGTTNWTLTGNSVVKGSFYGSNTATLIAGQSAVYGRLTGQSVRLADDAAVYFDHTLDSRMGYTNRLSPLYDEIGDIKTEVTTLMTLNESELLDLSDDLDVAVTTDNTVFRFIDGGIRPLDIVLAPMGPTPRPIAVLVNVVAVGTETVAWEDTAGVDASDIEFDDDGDGIGFIASSVNRTPPSEEVVVSDGSGPTADQWSSSNDTLTDMLTDSQAYSDDDVDVLSFKTRLGNALAAVDTKDQESALTALNALLLYVDGKPVPTKDLAVSDGHIAAWYQTITEAITALGGDSGDKTPKAFSK